MGGRGRAGDEGDWKPWKGEVGGDLPLKGEAGLLGDGKPWKGGAGGDLPYKGEG